MCSPKASRHSRFPRRVSRTALHTFPLLWVVVYAPRIHSVLSGWLVQSGLDRLLFAPEGFSAMLGQLAPWFYPFGSGAHCDNFY